MSLSFLGLLVAAGLVFASPALSADGTTQQRSVEEIEKIVHDYLYKNPQVILEAVERYREQEREKQAEQASVVIRQRKKDLFDDPTSPVVGDPTGDVTLVEFFDYRCPHCKRLAPSLAKLLKQDPKVRVVYKEFPILGPQSVVAARAALAAKAQDRYQPFHDALMNANSPLSEEEIMKIATSVGVDTDRLKTDMKDPNIEEAIQKNYALAQAIGISGTPALIVDDELIPGEIPFDKLKEMVAKARAKGS
jgi:protein-disulfide isomerase